jgi:DNA repair ATPase RecN
MALELSTSRRSASSHLRTAVEACLRQLAMEQSRFDVRIGWEPVDGPSTDGEGLVIGDGAAALGTASRADFDQKCCGRQVQICMR